MKRGLLVLMILLPPVVTAQEKIPGSTKDLAAVVVSGQGDPSTNSNEATSGQTDAVTYLGSSTNGPQQPSAKPPQSTKPQSDTEPKIPGSMVGYLDNPIPVSQIRVRFDAAFEDQFPDRSEFFYGKCGCYRAVGADPNAPGPPPGSTVSAIPNSLNFQQMYINGEYAPIRRFSVFAEVPVRWIQAQGFTAVKPGGTFPNQAGLGDVMAGFKLAAVASESTYLTFQFRSYFPSGDASKGLGTNHYSVEPSLLFYQKVSSRFTVEGQVGDWHPIGGSSGLPNTGSEGFAGDVFFYGIGPSYRLYSGNHFGLTPVVELFGWHVLSGFQTQIGGPIAGVETEVGGMNIVNLKAGVRTSIGYHNSFYVGFGQALTHDDWYKHIIRLEYRYVF
jgi:hypothetical protein